MIADLVADVLGDLLGGVLTVRSPRQPAGNQPLIRIHAGLRRPGRRFHCWWWHGYLDLGPDGSGSWVPSRPRPGRRIALPELRVGGSRAMTFAERWWWLNPGCRVFAADAAGDVVEIAVLQGDVRSLFAWDRRRERPVIAAKPAVAPG